jgi:hypothetical protein
MFKICIQFLFGEISEKFRLCTAVNLADTVDKFPFAHSDILQIIKAAPRPMSIDRQNFFSLTHQQTEKVTPYNTNHYIKGLADVVLQHIVKSLRKTGTVISMSNKIPETDVEFI